MKSLIVSLALLFCGSAFATQSYTGEIPTSSQWAVAMNDIICKTDFTNKEGYTGKTVEQNNYVIFEVYKNNNLVSSSAAKSAFILAVLFGKTKCF